MKHLKPLLIFLSLTTFFIMIYCFGSNTSYQSSSGQSNKNDVSKQNANKPSEHENRSEPDSQLADNYSTNNPSKTKGERYADAEENKRISPHDQPMSTFSIDVDTGSYTNMRRFIQAQGMLPPENSVRVEEFINYFKYNYPQPQGDHPFSIHYELAPSPFDKSRLLLQVGIQAKKLDNDERKPANIVFLIDTSGSMGDQNKLPLLISGLKLLTEQLNENDKLSIATYAGTANTALPITRGDKHEAIVKALEKLQASGSTNGSGGINQAYNLAKQGFIHNGVNRVILCTDGDFNVGVTSHNELISLIEKKRAEGIALTVLGFGTGNYNEKSMEQLADKGNGNYFYVDNLMEAHRVLVEELGSTLEIVAKDVKIQIEFNPKFVSSYRLFGYENRILAREDFNNDMKDAGEIGAGHSVTALYEITLVGNNKDDDSLHFQNEHQQIYEENKKILEQFKGEMAFFKLRYKKPNETRSILIEQPLHPSEIKNDAPSKQFMFVAAVAHFAEKLRQDSFTTKLAYNDIQAILKEAIDLDPNGSKNEFVRLVSLARTLDKRKVM